MSVQYGAISWNRQKKVYDVTLLSLLALYLGTFVGVGTLRNPSATAETLLIRALWNRCILAAERGAVHRPSESIGSSFSSTAL